MSEEQELISINLKAMNSDEMHAIQVPKDITVDSLKVLASDFTNIPVENMKLIFCGKSLKNGTKISEYNISDGQAIIVFKGRSQENRPAADPEPEPLPPPPGPRIDVRVSEINIPDGDNGNNSPQYYLNQIQTSLAKLQTICADLQISMADNNESQQREQANHLLEEINASIPILIRNANVLAEPEGGFPLPGRRNGRRPRIITHTVNREMTNPADFFRTLTSDLTNILGGIMNENQNNQNQQNQQQQAPAQPAPAPTEPQNQPDNSNTQGA
ncbi:Ubiquitin family protein [Trichomonas vaginalis G3]|uniref:Ubiquitin family protein n=1 Tax=Trichomonas vaginalis (strain ATCC PRA-98 / G3) TaxID=412133 RepID=A2DZ98_TRIV3|nr:ubiquitin-like family [Trichomonas vaginalis G3]EAY14227.1 Ubiquitin family protein [Trichomonas vaginalis G3]KAI5491835.1 ubiquitin-like family [Trichomonas vaginalis G3]|eukprot:XP_001326450.1 Ubiquitin family protein [Trichomonas vaginalis G3]